MTTEAVAKWMTDRSYATGHGDTVEDLLKELEWQIRESEREACAMVCEDEIKRVKPIYSVVAENVLKAIRARGNT